jgi:hypothetical protein
MVLMTPLLFPPLAMAQGAVTATLSVLTAPVERIAGDAGAPKPGNPPRSWPHRSPRSGPA